MTKFLWWDCFSCVCCNFGSNSWLSDAIFATFYSMEVLYKKINMGETKGKSLREIEMVLLLLKRIILCLFLFSIIRIWCLESIFKREFCQYEFLFYTAHKTFYFFFFLSVNVYVINLLREIKNCSQSHIKSLKNKWNI